MPTRTINQMASSPAGAYSRLYSTTDWRNSPRINGKLLLRANPLTHVKVECTRFLVESTVSGSYPLRPLDADEGERTPLGFNYSDVDNIAYNRWRGKLFKGGASVGVSLASWNQSRDMIVNRLGHLRRTLDSSIHALTGNKGALGRLKREREPLANQVLETEFGWRPLIGDVHAALTTVCQDGVPPMWVTGKGKQYVDVASASDRFGDHQRSHHFGFKTTVYGTRVSIANPNLWLLNRLGLINPSTVAWDLVPWSFVVNMFVNVNAMINSVTDTVGLSVSEHSITRSCFFRHDTDRWSDSFPGARAQGSRVIREKTRTLYQPLYPTFEVKVPDLNWELALIASSLVVQKFRKINNLIRAI